MLNEVAAAAAAPLLPPLGAKIQEHDRAAAAPCLACCVQLRQQTYRRELQVQLIAAPRLALASSTAWQPTLSAHMRRRPRTWPQRDRPQVGRHPYPQQCAGLHFNGVQAGHLHLRPFPQHKDRARYHDWCITSQTDITPKHENLSRGWGSQRSTLNMIARVRLLGSTGASG